MARGSGRKENEVKELLNRFAMMRQMMMQLGASTGLLGKIPGFKQLAQVKKMLGMDMNQLAGMMNTPSRRARPLPGAQAQRRPRQGEAQAQGRAQGPQERRASGVSGARPVG